MSESAEDKALVAYLKEHHEVDIAMQQLGGARVLNDVVRAFRAGAAWERSRSIVDKIADLDTPPTSG